MTHSHSINTSTTAATSPIGLVRHAGAKAHVASPGDLFSRLLTEMNAEAVAPTSDTAPASLVKVTAISLDDQPKQPIKAFPFDALKGSLSGLDGEGRQNKVAATDGDSKKSLLDLAKAKVAKEQTDEASSEPLLLPELDKGQQTIPMSIFLDRPNPELPAALAVTQAAGDPTETSDSTTGGLAGGDAGVIPPQVGLRGTLLSDRAALFDMNPLTGDQTPGQPALPQASQMLGGASAEVSQMQNAGMTQTGQGFDPAGNSQFISAEMPPLPTPATPLAAADALRAALSEGQITNQSSRKDDRPSSAATTGPEGQGAASTQDVPAATAFATYTDRDVAATKFAARAELISSAGRSSASARGSVDAFDTSVSATTSPAAAAAAATVSADAFTLANADGAPITVSGTDALAEQPGAELPTAPPVDVTHPEWEADFIDRITSAVTGEGSVIEIALAPENLGAVEVRLEIADGKAEVSFVTETSDAAKVFSQSESKLADLLQRQGLELSGQSASSRQDAKGNGSDHRNPQQRPEMKEPEIQQQVPASQTAGRLNLIA